MYNSVTETLEVVKDVTRLFVANNGERYIAFVEIIDNGENFATEVNSMQNICGAFC